MENNLKLQTLGGLRILRSDDEPVALGSRKAEAIFVYLACTGRTQSREALAELFWDERSQSQTMGNLRRELSTLRQGMGELVDISRQEVGLQPDAPLWVDVLEFEQALQKVGHGSEISDPELANQVDGAVTRLYQGAFLEGFTVYDCQGFDDWRRAAREHYQQLGIAGLHALITYELNCQDYPKGLAHAKRLLQLDPLYEAGHRQMMRLLALSGQRSAALQQYEACQRVLKDELGIQPSEETRELHQQILDERLDRLPPAQSQARGYQLRERIGMGGYGEVYRAYQPAVDRQVAIKVILPAFANQPDFIRRFEREARLVARLEHPHIVPLYDYWRDPNGAYLVMRWLRGGNLRASLQHAAWPVEAAARLLDQIAGALAVAHQQGVIHRDLKPENILLDEQENAYLTDFGIAKDLLDAAQASQTGGITGSPSYLSPEQARSEMVLPQSDLYSLGLVMYEVLTGEHPFPGLSPVAQLMKNLTEPLPSLRKMRPDLPEALEQVIQRVTAKDPGARFPDALAFAAAFRQAAFLPLEGAEVVSREVPPIAEHPSARLANPYRGLHAFEESDAYLFFGRDRLVQRLLASMDGGDPGKRFLAVVGPSGSGKSSLVRAGLLPAIRAGTLPGSRDWFVTDMQPGTHPLEELELALLNIAVHRPSDLLPQLREDPRGLLRSVRRILPRDEQLLLFVDQFEEVFTLAQNQDEAKQFLDSLFAAVSEPRSPLHVIITLRADFYDRPLLVPDFARLMQEHTDVVIPLSAEELEQAVRKPCERAGAQLESGLTAQIVADVAEQPGALPLFQYALTQLFERRQENLLTFEAYQALGGISGVIGRCAEAEYEKLDANAQAAARQVFLRLVTLGEGVEDTRRRVLRQELESLGVQAEPALQAFGRARLLSFDHDPATRAPTVEVAHEALLRQWPRLRGWLDESRAELRMQRALGLAAAEWEAGRREASFLLRGARLEQFEVWSQSTGLALTASEQEYLRAALAQREVERQAEAERQRKEARLVRARQNFLRAFIGVLIVGLIVAAGLSIYAFSQRREALDQRREALDQRTAAQKQNAVLLAEQAKAEMKDGYYDLAVLLALEAVEKFLYTPQAENALGQTVSFYRARMQYLGHTDIATSVAWSPDGTRLATSSFDNTVRVWDAASGKQILLIELPRRSNRQGYELDQTAVVRWTPDGKSLLTIASDRFYFGTQNYNLILWDAASGAQLRSTSVPNQTPPEIIPELAGLGNYFLTGDAAAFAPANGRLATLGGDNTALVWDANWQAVTLQPKVELTLTGHTNDVNSVAWSPDETRLATASLDGSVRVWDAQTGAQILILEGHESGARTALWSPDGKTLATLNQASPGVVRIWGASSGELLHTIQPLAGQIYSLAWSPDGDRLATGHEGGRIRVWDVASGQMLFMLSGHPMGVTHLAWSPVDQRLASVDMSGAARTWNAAISTAYFSIDLQDWSRDGRYFVVVGSAIEIWDIQTRKPVVQGIGSGLGLSYLWQYLSPDGNYVTGFASSENPDDMQKYRVFDVHSGQLVQTLQSGAGDMLIGADWSPDGSKLAIGSSTGLLYIYDFATGRLLKQITAHVESENPFFQWTYTPEWSPDGSKIVSGGGDSVVHIWDAVSGENLLTYRGHQPPEQIKGAHWSPDGKRILTTGGEAKYNTVRIWDSDTGKDLLVLPLAGGAAQGWWFPDGKRFTTSGGSEMNVWDASNGDNLLTLTVPADPFLTGLLSPDGKYIRIGGVTTTNRIWRVWGSTEELLAYAHECCVFRDLTPEERQRFGLPLDKTAPQPSPTTPSTPGAALLQPLALLVIAAGLLRLFRRV